MFMIRDTYLHRMACFELFNSLSTEGQMIEESKNGEDVNEEKKDDAMKLEDQIFIPYARLTDAINDEWESYPHCRTIIVENIHMLGLILKSPRLSLNHNFFHIKHKIIPRSPC